MTVPATNKKIEMRVAFVDSFKDGKIWRERAYYDLAGLMQQLGVSPTGK
jgi:ketosteroid isomerase-like protein